MQKIISDALYFFASGKKQLAIQDIEQAVKNRDLSFNEINDHHYCYDIKDGEKKLREVQIDEDDEYYRLYYLPEKSTTGIKVYIHGPAHDHLKTMVKVIFSKLCSESDFRLGIAFLEESARLLKCDIEDDDGKIITIDEFKQKNNDEWIKGFVHNNVTDILLKVESLNEEDVAIMPGVFRDFYIGKNTLKRLKQGEPESLDERFMHAFWRLNYFGTGQKEVDENERTIHGVSIHNMSVLKGEKHVDIVYAICDSDLPPLIVPKVDYVRLWRQETDQEYFLSFSSFMKLLSNKVEFYDERHFLVDEKNGFDWAEVSEAGEKNPDIKLRWAILDKKGRKIQSLDKYDNLLWPLDKYLLVIKDDNYGLIDTKGNEVVSPYYDYIGHVDEEMIFAYKDGKEGIINFAGEVIVPFVYDRIDYFYGGFAKVKKDGRSGFIDRIGNPVIPCKYDEAKYFSEGLAYVRVNEKKYFIDTSGNAVISVQYDNVSNFYEGFCCVCSSRKYGFINKEGEEIGTLQYEYAGHFHEGRACIIKNNKYGFIDNKGNEVVPAQYDGLGGILGEFRDGLICVIKKNGHEGDDEKIITYREEADKNEVPGLETGPLILCVMDGPHGYIDKNGNEIIPFQYEEASSFSNGLAHVQKDGKVGFIDKTGRTIIPFIYEHARFFSKGLAPVKKDGKYGCINTEGRVIIPFLYDDIEHFHEGIIIVTKDSKKGVIDRNGKTVIEPQYDHLFEHYGSIIAGNWVIMDIGI